jgi:hypothetical protein
MLNPTMKKWKARSAEMGLMMDGHGQRYEEVESVSSHHHHYHQRAPAGSVAAPAEGVKSRVRRRGGWRGREREKEKGKSRETNSDAGSDATQDHEEAEETVSSYYFNLPQLLSHHQVVRNLFEYMNFYEWCILSSISKEIRMLLVQSPPLRKKVLERFLGMVDGAGMSQSHCRCHLRYALVLLLNHQADVSLPRSGLHARSVNHPNSQHVHPLPLDPPQHSLSLPVRCSTCGYTRVVLRLRAQAENKASVARTKALYAPAPLSPSSTPASAYRSTTKVNTHGSSNASRPVSGPSSRAP